MTPSPSRVPGWAVILATAAAIAILFVVNAPQLRAPYDWDEANYIAAAKLGVAANLLERGSMEPGEFLRMARAKHAGATYETPPGYEEERDPLLRRHYHPPAVVAALALLPTYRPEWVPRVAQLVVGAVFIVVLIQLHLWLTPTRGPVGLVAVAALAAWAAVLGFAALSYHGWEAMAAVLAAVAAGRWLQGSSGRNLAACGLVLGASLLVLVTGIYVVAAVVLVLLLAPSPRTRRERLRAAGQSLGLAALVVLLVWPGVILRASALKIPAFHVYRAQIGSEFAAVSERLPGVIVVMAPLGVAALCAAFAKRPWPAPMTALVVTGTVYTAALMPLALMPVYLLPGAVPLGIAASCAIASWRSWRRQLAALAALVASIAVSVWAIAPAQAGRLVREDVDRMVERVGGRRAFVDGAHIYDLYLDGRARLRQLAVSFDGETFTLRERGHYRPLTPEDMAGSLIAAQRKRVRTDQTPRALAGCRDLGETEMLRWFDCALPP